MRTRVLGEEFIKDAEEVKLDMDLRMKLELNYLLGKHREAITILKENLKKSHINCT